MMIMNSSCYRVDFYLNGSFVCQATNGIGGAKLADYVYTIKYLFPHGIMDICNGIW